VAIDWTRFGAELRWHRQRRDLSLRELAKLVHYSPSHLSKIEDGSKHPSADLVRRLDHALVASGELVLLATDADARDALDQRPAGNRLAESQWLLSLEPRGAMHFLPLSHSETAAVDARLGLRATVSLSTRAASVEAGLHALRQLFDGYRTLGQSAAPALVMPSLIAQTHAVRSLAANAGGQLRAALLRLGSRYAEYTGWMAQEAGDETSAMWWTRQAVELAEAGEDATLATYALVRQSLVALYRDDVTQTVSLAQQAQARPATSQRIAGLAALREAQGLALGFDTAGCRRALARAGETLENARGADPTEPVLGTTHVPDPIAATTGWCLLELARPAEAVPVLERAMLGIPATAYRARARWGVRLVLAHAEDGETDRACELARELLPLLEVVDSATIRTDVRRLRRVLGRQPRRPAVHELMPEITNILSSPSLPL
jgi:transcriptional regulator with XRE-family HTH domain